MASLWRDARGNSLPIFAASLVPLLAIVGGGVDAARGYLAKTQLQNACDAGVLAGRRAMAKSGEYGDTEAGKATQMFNANFDSDIVTADRVNFDTEAGDEGDVFGTASARIPTVLMKLFGKYDLSFSVDCMAELQITNSDIMFVLDTTGSMGGSRISGLRQAVRDFHQTITSAVTDDDVRVRYGFVPYSTTVNAKELLDEGEITSAYFRDSTPYQTRFAVFNRNDYIVREKKLTDSGQYNTSGYSCDNSWSNSSGTKPNNVNVTYYREESRGWFSGCRVRWETYRYSYENKKAYHFNGWVYRQGNLNTSDYKDFDSVEIATDFDPEMSYLSTSGEYAIDALAKLSIRGMSKSSSRWNGCIQERDTVETDDFDPVPSDAYDLDINLTPDSPATSWSPIWPDASYYRTPGTTRTSSGTKTTSAPCPAPMLPFQTIDLSTTAVPGWLETYLRNLNATGNTYHDIGMIWGARLASPNGILADNVNEDSERAESISRHLIFMTDGKMEPHIQSFTAYGVEYTDNRIAPAWSSTGAVADRHTQRFLAACDGAKDEGYTIWVIGFGESLTDAMRSCATGHRAYFSNDNDELRATFRYIASQVADLRLAQ
ncbi:TadE/TadG family type IV pilus assembly protein [Pelagerythrobacter sp.]|uniref:TadE/TadG family type IV pilus assembly protein n=1 Tax=Pelagerythrobacter sp. TaxID=2800702 RepID=UPI0035B46F41